MRINVSSIVSGGQTGADRAALDAAESLGMDSGGWIPKGRKAEDGEIPTCYSTLKENTSPKYADRTELNVRDSDATVIISNGPLQGGSALTLEFTHKHKRPVLHIDLQLLAPDQARSVLRLWLAETDCRILNVAGPRSSSDPEIYSLVKELLLSSLKSLD